MKLSKLALLAAFACGIHAGSATAQQANTDYFGEIAQVGCFDSDNCCEPECGCESVGCDDCGGCDGCGCGVGGGGIFFDDGSLPSLCIGDCGGDPWLLCGNHWGWDKGGWLQIGYHDKNNLLGNFNDHDDRVRLHQAWFYMEKVADGSNGFDIGGRVDYVYGVDAQNTQAFGQISGWDNGWDNGIYGSAIPQAYAEMAYGDLSLKVGHFYTIIGYEVVTAPDNFFYSHAWTMNTTEPFTHSGALATYNMSDETTLYGGWTSGWDSGFDYNGTNLIAGISQQLDDTTNVTLAYVGGRFGLSSADSTGAVATGGEHGDMWSIVTQKSFSDNLNYVFQVDRMKTKYQEIGGRHIYARETWSFNQYLFYQIDDCWAAGARFEWWNVDGEQFVGTGRYGDNHDIYDLTLGVNYRGNPNWIIRPEVRFTWDKDAASTRAGVDNFAVNENAASVQTTFGIDGIFTF